MYSVLLSSYRNTRESLGELEKAVKTLACGSYSHSISRSPKLALVLLFNKLTSVFYASVLLLIMNFVNIVKVAVDPRGDSRVDPQAILTCYDEIHCQ